MFILGYILRIGSAALKVYSCISVEHICIDGGSGGLLEAVEVS